MENTENTGKTAIMALFKIILVAAIMFAIVVRNSLLGAVLAATITMFVGSLLYWDIIGPVLKRLLKRQPRQEGEEEQETKEPGGWARWLTPLILIFSVGLVMHFLRPDLLYEYGFWLILFLLACASIIAIGLQKKYPWIDKVPTVGALLVGCMIFIGPCKKESSAPRKDNTNISSKETGGFLYKCVEVSKGEWSEWLDIPPPEYYTKWDARFEAEGKEEDYIGVWVRNIKGEIRKYMKDDKNHLGDAVSDPVFQYMSMNDAKCKICVYLKKVYASR